MAGLRTLLRIQIGMLAIFIVLKAVRPRVIAVNAPDWISAFLYSFPNFAEAIIGVMITAMILLILNARLLNSTIKEMFIYHLSTIIAGLYVISQEYKFHNLGGNNIYDFNDVIYSIIGLGAALLILIMIKPKIYPNIDD